MLELETARARILDGLAPLPAETVPVNAAAGRFAAEAVAAPLDLPPFDNSAMDGYAVRAEDVKAARADAPVALRLLGRAAAGAPFTGQLAVGSCVRLFTGSPLPAGADAVVMQEDTRAAADRLDHVLVLDAVKPWESVRFRGEDVKRGAPLCAVGERLSAGGIGLLAAAGVKQVAVARAPVIALLATGSELLEPGEPLAPGRIFESNRASLAALLRQAGAVPRAFPLAPDDAAATRAGLERAFAEADAVVTTGGASVGELDFIKEAFAALGGQLDFWKVAIKPGKPFVFGRWRDKALFGLPGNPVSAFVTFLLLVRPAVLRMQGAGECGLPSHPGVLAEPLANPGERRHFVRVVVDAAGRVRSAGRQASHALSSLARANGLVDLPPGASLPAGATVSVLTWES